MVKGDGEMKRGEDTINKIMTGCVDRSEKERQRLGRE